MVDSTPDRGVQLLMLRRLQLPESMMTKHGQRVSAFVAKAVLRDIDDRSEGWKTSIRSIAQSIQASDSGVVRAVEVLSDQGFIVVYKKEGCSSSYRLNWSKIAEATATPRVEVIEEHGKETTTPRAEVPLPQRQRVLPQGQRTTTPGADITNRTESKRKENEGSPPSSKVENEILSTWNSSMGQRCELTPKRRAILRSRLNVVAWSQRWKLAIEQARQCPFLMGENERGWKADFEWFLKPDSVTKILEGKYRSQSFRGSTDDEYTDFTALRLKART
jgi:DNA-binding MarR family transcriptional regulator